MVSGYVEAFLRASSAASVIDVFIYALTALLVFALFWGFKARQPSRFVSAAPSMLVSVGILGTFIGIVIGLLNFDPHDIKSSIETLLEGLKTAFITSLFGVTYSVALKLIDSTVFTSRQRKYGTQADDVTAADIYGVMQGQEQLLKGIGQSLSGQEEGSVAGQLRLLRTDISDFRNGLNRQHETFQSALFEQLQKFGQMLAKSATETVINALRDVIHDFNKHLKEEFGENFKELNQAVEKMTQWQDNYKEHVENLENRLEIAIRELERTATANEAISKALGETEQSIDSIENHCQRIPAAVEQLTPILDVNQHQILELERHLEAFISMREQATRAVPELQDHMNKLAEDLSTKIETLMTTMHEGALEFGRSADRTNAALTENAHVISTTSEEINRTMSDASKDFSSSVRDTLEIMQRNTRDLEENMARTVEQVSKGLEEQLRKVSDQLHDRISEAITKTLATMQSSVEESVDRTQRSIRDSSSVTLRAVEDQVTQAAEHSHNLLRNQLENLNKSITEELEHTFRQLGSALATISARIADDHQALTYKLRQLDEV